MLRRNGENRDNVKKIERKTKWKQRGVKFDSEEEFEEIYTIYIYQHGIVIYVIVNYVKVIQVKEKEHQIMIMKQKNLEIFYVINVM